MARTENGWETINSNQLDRSRLILDDGRSIPAETHGGDSGLILRAFFRWLDRNVDRIDRGTRDEWFWSATNDVADSNHLSGTAGDYNASKWPWQRYTMPQDMVNKIREGVRLFQGTIFWGRDWSRPDEMHFQIQGNAAQIKPFADKLRAGFLSLVEGAVPADPNALPLPLGYYYGPLDGPNESVSGLFGNESQRARDGLGRWQQEVGLVATKVWDADTAKVVAKLQADRGWDKPENPYKGVIYTGEWDAVIKEKWRYTAPPTGPEIVEIKLKPNQTLRVSRA